MVVRVCARIKPPLDDLSENDDGFISYSSTSISVPVLNRGILVNSPDSSDNTSLMFEFSRVFGKDTSQEAVYDDLLKSCSDRHMCLFLYGPTGSGKTYTMFGGGTYSSRGLAQRAALDMLHVDSTLNISVYEIFGECVYDLLDTRNMVTPSDQWIPLVVQEVNGNVVLPELSVLSVSDELQVVSLLSRASYLRTQKRTDANSNSSRSHCVVILTEVDRITGITIRVLTLVDLAGAEKVHSRSPDGISINLSLHHLEQCILSLGKVKGGRHKHIPFRNSTLTAVLRDRLIMSSHISPLGPGSIASSTNGGPGLVFLVTLSTSRSDRVSTLSACRFALRCAEMKPLSVRLQEPLEDSLSSNESLKLQRMKEERNMLAAAFAEALRRMRASERELSLLRITLNEGFSNNHHAFPLVKDEEDSDESDYEVLTVSTSLSNKNEREVILAPDREVEVRDPHENVRSFTPRRSKHAVSTSSERRNVSHVPTSQVSDISTTLNFDNFSSDSDISIPDSPVRVVHQLSVVPENNKVSGRRRELGLSSPIRMRYRSGSSETAQFCVTPHGHPLSSNIHNSILDESDFPVIQQNNTIVEEIIEDSHFIGNSSASDNISKFSDLTSKESREIMVESVIRLATDAVMPSSSQNADSGTSKIPVIESNVRRIAEALPSVDELASLSADHAEMAVKIIKEAILAILCSPQVLNEDGLRTSPSVRNSREIEERSSVTVESSSETSNSASCACSNELKLVVDGISDSPIPSTSKSDFTSSPLATISSTSITSPTDVGYHQNMRDFQSGDNDGDDRAPLSTSLSLHPLLDISRSARECAAALLHLSKGATFIKHHIAASDMIVRPFSSESKSSLSHIIHDESTASRKPSFLNTLKRPKQVVVWLDCVTGVPRLCWGSESSFVSANTSTPLIKRLLSFDEQNQLSPTASSMRSTTPSSLSSPDIAAFMRDLPAGAKCAPMTSLNRLTVNNIDFTPGVGSDVLLAVARAGPSCPRVCLSWENGYKLVLEPQLSELELGGIERKLQKLESDVDNGGSDMDDSMKRIRGASLKVGEGIRVISTTRSKEKEILKHEFLATKTVLFVKSCLSIIESVSRNELEVSIQLLHEREKSFQVE